MECEDDGTDTEHTTKYLDRDQVRKLVDLGRLFKQSGQTILNLLFQIEEVSENKASDDELIRSLGKDDVIGCLLLSSKYFESGHFILNPNRVRKFFSEFSTQEICRFELAVAKKLEYDIDQLLVSRYNFWFVVDSIIFDFKHKFELKEKYFLALCRCCEHIAVQLMYECERRVVEAFHTESLAASIIISGFQRIDINRPFPGALMRYLVGISHYEDEEHLLEAAVEIQALVYKDVMT